MEAPESGILSSVFAALLRPYLRSLDKPSLPKYHGELGLAGLKKNVTVRWDPHGIPHVFAADEPVTPIEPTFCG